MAVKNTSAGKTAKRKTIAVFFGGRSAEHEVSLLSARSVIDNIDRSRFSVLAVFVDRNGRWRKADADSFAIRGVLPPEASAILAPVPGGGPLYEIENGNVSLTRAVDAVFSLVHGTDGEDGVIQGVFESWDIPYVGARVTGSAIAADKLTAKRLLQNAGLPVVRFAAVEKSDWHANGDSVITQAADQVGVPCFVKPSNLGSSIGIYKIENPDDIAPFAVKSFEFSDTVIFESAVPDAREIEVSVLGLDKPEISVPGEIVPAGDFYDYNSKYRDTGSKLLIPAFLPPDIRENVRTAAGETFAALRCTGMARVDFLLDSKTGEFFVSELNSIPGFTSISMYPKLWEASGVPYPDLISRLIDIAFECALRKKNLNIEYKGT